MTAAAFPTTRYYFVHGRGRTTVASLGRQALSRELRRAGLPAPDRVILGVEYLDASGRTLHKADKPFGPDEEFFLDSAEAFGPPGERELEGSVRFGIKDLGLPPGASAPAASLNGIFLVHEPGRFVTGVHMYHDEARLPFVRRAKHYVKRAALRVAAAFTSPWADEALGASMVHGGEGRPFYVMHVDDSFPGVGSFLECRAADGTVSRSSLPATPAGGTIRAELPAGEGWTHLLCALPPAGVGRFLTGERFPDGRFCVDHNYFQQPAGTRDVKVTGEVRAFPRALLGERLIGPSNPWPCLHGGGVETSIAVPNQFRPDRRYVYDVLVFDEKGALVLRLPAAMKVEPYGTAVLDLSAELRRAGIERLEGSYLVCHSAGAPQEELPSRLHAQSLYRFAGGYWNAVQSDAHIWSSPSSPVPQIEALPGVKVRRRQLWYSPVIESDSLETLISLSNLSYSLDYDKTQRLRLGYCEGDRELATAEIEIPPFGSILTPVDELFPGLPARRGYRRGIVTIWPLTGTTYCGSVVVRDRASGVFMMEHTLRLPKLPGEQ